MTAGTEPWDRPRRPVRKVAKVTKDWNGYCPKCGRGADGFAEWIYCDCDETTPRRERTK